MKVVIKAYSVLRDIIGETVELETSMPITVKELVNFLREKYNVPGDFEVVVIVDGRVVSEDYTIHKETVLYVTPPFSGGSNVVVDVRLLKEEERLDFNTLFKEIVKLDPEAGALSIFIGFVKGRVNTHEVYELEYSAIEDVALEQLKRIAREEAEKYGLRAIVLWHYIGKRKPGEITLLIATIAKDRTSSISAMRNVLERVKREAPIFKLEKRSDGDYWILGDGKKYPKRG